MKHQEEKYNLKFLLNSEGKRLVWQRNQSHEKIGYDVHKFQMGQREKYIYIHINKANIWQNVYT